VAPPTPQAPDFQALLEEETRELRAFLQLLENERDALMQRDADPLVSIADEKNRASARLQALGLRRMQWLANQGLDGRPESVNGWLTRSSNNENKADTWRHFFELARRARDLNHANGALIRSRMQYGQQALAVLLAASNQATFYGPDGQSFSGLGKRHLGSV
jgi:flagellar biosynthesis protein FlgN